jgi:hypothetical protein
LRSLVKLTAEKGEIMGGGSEVSSMERVIFEKQCEINHTERVKCVIRSNANHKRSENLEEKKQKKISYGERRKIEG